LPSRQEDDRACQALALIVDHDQDPDHHWVADLKARIDAGGALDSTGRTWAAASRRPVGVGDGLLRGRQQLTICPVR
jgi:hypothetical protein